MKIDETDPKEIKKELLSRLRTMDITTISRTRSRVGQSNEYVVLTDVEADIEEVLEIAIAEVERRLKE